MTTSSLAQVKRSRGDKVIAFIQAFCRVPEGKHVGKPLRLEEFQKQFIREVYDNPAGTARAYLSLARKNGKTGLIAAILLAHLVGPEARQNTQIVSGARSREQAGLVFKLAEKMVRLNPDLSKVVRVVPSQKILIGLARNVEFKALSADAGTAHGLSPVLAILDEVGQIKGPQDDFVEAIETAQGAHDDPLLIAISTQAATDGDLFSKWLDDAKASADPRIVSHVYAAPEGCEITDREAWRAANPALGSFRSLKDMEDFAAQAERLPSKENSFRWLFLNQRIDGVAKFINRTAWEACNAPAVSDWAGRTCYAGLDLAKAAEDMTAFVLVAPVDGLWHVRPHYWLPAKGLAEKSKLDAVPYDVWYEQGFLELTPGSSVDYDHVAQRIEDILDEVDALMVAYDPYNWTHMRPALIRAGRASTDLPDAGEKGSDKFFRPFRQGFLTMSPAVTVLETAILERKIVHGGHPLLNMNADNAAVERDPAGNRKLSKVKSRGRIDGMVALAMAMSVADTFEAQPVADVFAMIA